MSTYKEFEKTVFNWLMAKYKEDPQFTFSLRQVASKGSETDYFIGTEKSNYFATTFWRIPVSYPGNAQELIGLIFKLNNGEFSYSFQFLQTKNPNNDQNKFGLELIRNLKPTIKSIFPDFFENPEINKMEYFGFKSEKYSEVKRLLNDVGNDIMKLLPVVDEEIQKMRSLHPEFIGSRFSKEHFEKMYGKMEIRRSTYENTRVTISKGQASIEIEKVRNGIIENHFNKDQKAPLNRILYGPPGTGKTFHTISHAVAIIEGISPESVVEETNNNRVGVKKRFDDYVEDGLIVFTTFHQSMSYEDFIEGIKPLPPKKDEDLKYDLMDDIFKKLCDEAESNWFSINRKGSNLIFEDVFEEFQEKWEEDRQMKFEMRTPSKEFTVTGFSNKSISFKKASGGEAHTLSINTLKDIFYLKREPANNGVGLYYPGIIKKLNQITTSSKKDEINPLNYVIIIDEINRGNVSQIFGELITSIEEDKRIDGAESLKITLPYSKDQFGVPPNVFIIGTMNTADRSVEALDTALRRRFVFDEMLPLPELLSTSNILLRFLNDFDSLLIPEENFSELREKLWQLLGCTLTYDESDRMWNEFKEDEINQTKSNPFQDISFSGIDFQLLLEKINERIEKILGSDQQIGHAFFINVRSLEKLYKVFYQKIIPQLQEYFYGDFGKIGLILGKRFIEEQKKVVEFADFEYEDKDLLAEKKVYRINNYGTNDEIDWEGFSLAVKNIYQQGLRNG